MPNLHENGCIKAPGLAIGTATTTFSYANTFRVKANGMISDDVTTLRAIWLLITRELTLC